ncbi:MAG: AmmeMemoRadiSam system protein B [Ignavibacteriales bacterium]|nr:AmmeMemoRadiSam system protein B [Ignavibacteriales bacterium]
MTRIRPTAVAGMFYPGDAAELSRNVNDLLLQADVSLSPAHGQRPATSYVREVVALISPHAGYVYSGLTAAHAYALVRGLAFDAVIVVGPNHREYSDRITIYPGDAYCTPLGTIPIHDEIRSALVAHSQSITISEIGHRSEHCIEVQLPFLQKVLGEFKLVPVIMGEQHAEMCNDLARAIAAVCREKTVLLVASSDLSHYHDYTVANRLDAIVAEEVSTFRPQELIHKLQSRRVEACGGGPMVAVMTAAKMLGATKSLILHRCNSGDTGGARDSVVGYLSAAFMR